MKHVTHSPEGQKVFKETIPQLVTTMEKLKMSADRLYEVSGNISKDLRNVREGICSSDETLREHPVCKMSKVEDAKPGK